MKKTKEILNKILKELKNNKWIHYVLLLIIGISLSIGLKNIQIRETHDGSLHFLRLLGTKECFDLGQIIPLINPYYCSGFGYSMNLFYPPLVTYVPLLISLITKDYLIALKLFGALCICLSGITMYKFTYQVTKNRIISFFAGVFYLIAPYKLANVYKRFAIGEFTALVFIPITFLGLYNLFNQDGKKHYCIAIGAIGLMLSHTVTTLYTAMFCLIYICFNIKKIKQKEIVIKCIINIVFILLISMLFWLPLLEVTNACEYTIMDDSIMRTNGNFASDNVISFSQLFKDKQEENGTTFLLGFPTIIAIILTIFAYKKVELKYKDFYLISIIFSMISLIMASRFFPWQIMPGLICKLQYPWRMLGYFNFFMSFVCGINIYIIAKQISKKDSIRVVAIFVFVIISITCSNVIMIRFYAKDKEADSKYIEYILENKKISHKSINRDYMPVNALFLQNTYMQDREERTYVLNGNVEIIKEEKKEFSDIIEIKNATKNTEIEFPYLFYIGYEAELESDNKTTKLELKESENGFLSCTLPDDINDGTIKVKYVSTKLTYASYTISLVSFIIFIAYIIYENKKVKGKKDE